MKFFYEIQGDGEPVLLLHGFTGSAQTWKELTPLLPFLLVLPDLAGHGRTQRPADRLETEAMHLKKMMAKAGYDSFHLIGYSMGGRLALSLALLYPEQVKSLILESASPGLRTDAERKARVKSDEQLAQRIEKEGIPSFVDYWESIPMFHTQQALPLSDRQKIRWERLSHPEQGLASSLRFMGTGAQPSYWDRLHELRMPVMLLTGTEDEKFTSIARKMKESIPMSEWIEFQGAGHAIHVEQREKFGTIVKTFLLNQKGGNPNGI